MTHAAHNPRSRDETGSLRGGSERMQGGRNMTMTIDRQRRRVNTPLNPPKLDHPPSLLHRATSPPVDSPRTRSKDEKKEASTSKCEAKEGDGGGDGGEGGDGGGGGGGRGAAHGVRGPGLPSPEERPVQRHRSEPLSPPQAAALPRRGSAGGAGGRIREAPAYSGLSTGVDYRRGSIRRV